MHPASAGHAELDCRRQAARHHAFRGDDVTTLSTTLSKRRPQGTLNLIAAAKQRGIKRFVLVTSIGADDLLNPLNLFWGVLFWKKRAEEELQRSGLTYTIVRPGGLKSKLREVGVGACADVGQGRARRIRGASAHARCALDCCLVGCSLVSTGSWWSSVRDTNARLRHIVVLATVPPLQRPAAAKASDITLPLPPYVSVTQGETAGNVVMGGPGKWGVPPAKSSGSILRKQVSTEP